MGRRLKNYGQGADLGTIATTGNTDKYLVVRKSGTVVAVLFSGFDALAGSDSNYLTFSITNLGQVGAGAVNILGAVNANTTKNTGGSPIAANTKRNLVLSTTATDLVVTEGDRLRVRAAAAGTTNNTVTFSNIEILIDANGQ